MLTKVVWEPGCFQVYLEVVFLIRVTEYLFLHLHDFISLFRCLLCVVYSASAQTDANLLIVRVVLGQASSLAHVDSRVRVSLHAHLELFLTSNVSVDSCGVELIWLGRLLRAVINRAQPILDVKSLVVRLRMIMASRLHFENFPCWLQSWRGLSFHSLRVMQLLFNLSHDRLGRSTEQVRADTFNFILHLVRVSHPLQQLFTGSFAVVVTPNSIVIDTFPVYSLAIDTLG